MSRTIVVWCPDWPAVAAARQANRPASDPVAVLHANRVRACTAAARAQGVHVGQRRRDAQSRCPDLLITGVDQDRDARMFEPVAAAVESLAPGVEVLRCGVVACPARGPARYFGSEAAAAERIVDAVEALDVECCIGIADDLEIAVLAAHRSVLVPPGESAAFCAGLPITDLSRDPAIGPPDRVALTDLLIRLGITTAGAFAALPPERWPPGSAPTGCARTGWPWAGPSAACPAGRSPRIWSSSRSATRRWTGWTPPPSPPGPWPSGSTRGSPTPAWPAPGWSSPPPPTGAPLCPAPGAAPRR